MTGARLEKRRLTILCGLMVLFFALVVGRLVQLQITRSSELAERVRIQSEGNHTLAAERGTILDRTGRVVAKSVTGMALTTYPHSNEEVTTAGIYLDSLFGYRRGTAGRRYALAPRQFTYVRRRIDDRLARHIDSTAPRGIHLRKEPTRQYPYGLVGRQILGFTDIDHNGQSGFELAFDSLLAGKAGQADVRRNGHARAFRVTQDALINPIPGRSLMLTLDWRLQEIVEEELAAAAAEHGATIAMAAFVDVRNGDILAMAHHDTNERNRHRPTKLRAIADQYEPGSSAKAFVLAALLDEQIARPSDSIFCEEGLWRIEGSKPLRDAKPHGWLSLREVFDKSSNIGIAKLTVALGGEKLDNAYRRFGLGEETNCGLPGEADGVVSKPGRWTERTIASRAMGHGVSATALQMASAFAAIANGGTLYRPRLIRGEVDERFILTRTGKPERLRRVFDRDIVDTLHSMLRSVITDGTAQKALSDLVSIAGKTGTPQLIDDNGQYSNSRYGACFGGFFPYDQPVVAGYVYLSTFDHLTEAGVTAAPLFRSIAERFTVACPDMFSVPERTLFARSGGLVGTVTTPDFNGHTVHMARAMAAYRGIQLCLSAAEGTVVWQYPPPDQPLFDSAMVVAIVDRGDQTHTLPDLSGLPLHLALTVLSELGQPFRVTGHGVVRSQSLRAGAIVDSNQTLHLVCNQV